MQELKPCPFCGSEDLEFIDCRNAEVGEDWVIQCKCGVAILTANGFRDKSKEALTEKWNRRADNDQS